MPHRPRPAVLDHLAAAPLRLVAARGVSAPADAVHRAPEDVSGRTDWFPRMTSARPVDGGAGRDITLAGGARFREPVLAAKEPEVYAYRADVTKVPGCGRSSRSGGSRRPTAAPGAVDLRHGRRGGVPVRPAGVPGGAGAGVPGRRDRAGPPPHRAMSPLPGQTPVASSESIAAVYGSMSSPWDASQVSE